MRKLVLILVPIFANLLFGQSIPSGDCDGAIPLPNGLYDMPVYGPSLQNDSLEINAGVSCLSMGELAGYWFKIMIQNSGNLSFNIIPYLAGSDYDWALYNLTDSNCFSIRSDAALEARCNYSNSVNNMAITGANGGPNNQDEPVLHVLSGEIFKLYVYNYSASLGGNDNSGFRIDFGSSSCTLDPSIGIPNNPLSAQIKLGPNPTSGFLNVSINPGILNEINELKLMDLTGKTLFSQSNNFSSNLRFDLSNQPAGLYFLQIITLSKQHSIKIILEK